MKWAIAVVGRWRRADRTALISGLAWDFPAPVWPMRRMARGVLGLGLGLGLGDERRKLSSVGRISRSKMAWDSSSLRM